jgi:hypothetical protein
MSPAAVRRLSRARRRLCVECLHRRARFRFRGAVRADRDHTLCFRCFRSERERRRARQHAESRASGQSFWFGTEESLSARGLPAPVTARGLDLLDICGRGAAFGLHTRPVIADSPGAGTT